MDYDDIDFYEYMDPERLLFVVEKCTELTKYSENNECITIEYDADDIIWLYKVIYHQP